MKKILLTALCALTLVSVTSVDAKPRTDEAQKLYEQHQDDVYQIQVVDLASGKKAAAGSGFQFSPDGFIATNYHVISNALLFPKRYRVECIRSDDSVGELSVIGVDVIHDLAILKGDAEDDTFIELGNSDISKGTKIFSLGNPYDLGMTIIEGTYNGLEEKSFYQKILFSGSINSGMSGGPAIDREGKAIGVNVSTAGNQVSFLVPVDNLRILKENVLKKGSDEPDWYQYIEKQLTDNQNRYMELILSSDWDKVPIGDAVVPGELTEVFKCWGDSMREDDKKYTFSLLECVLEDLIFVSDGFYTGKIMYKYTWLKSKELNTFQFYNYYERNFTSYDYKNAGEKDVTNFQCHTDFVNLDEGDWKVGMCVRRYKKYSNLYDLDLVLASVDKKDRGLKLEVVAFGLTKDKIKGFVAKFLKDIQWKKLL